MDWCKHPDRLERLAKHLETVEGHRFNMCYFGIEMLGKCGFQACAMGHACDIPEFRDLGLRRVDDGPSEEANVTKMYNVTLGDRGDSVDGFSAAMVLFGIDASDAILLFDSAYDDKTPARMAERLRVFIKGGHEAVAQRDIAYYKQRRIHGVAG